MKPKWFQSHTSRRQRGNKIVPLVENRLKNCTDHENRKVNEMGY